MKKFNKEVSKSRLAKTISLFTICNFFKVFCSLLITIPLTTYYLEVKELGLVVLFTTISNILLQPLQCGGVSIINAYYFSKTKLFMKKFLFHLYFFPFFLKIILIIVALLFIKFTSIGEVFLNLGDVKTFFYILISNALISSRQILFQISTNDIDIIKYFKLLFSEIIFINFSIFIFVSEMPNSYGYAKSLLISSIIIILFDINYVRKKIVFNLDTRYLKIIYKKGLRLYPYEFLLTIIQRFDYLLVSKYLSTSSLAILQHAKSYPEKIEILMKSYYQSLNVHFMNYLKNKSNILMKSVMIYDTIWYIVLLLGGLITVLFMEDIIKTLTHNKLTEAYIYLCFFYISLFFRSNQQFFISILQYNKKIELFTISSTVLSFFYFLALLFYHWMFGINLQVIILLFLLHSLLKWIVLQYLSAKHYSFHRYKVIPFYLSLFSYLAILVFYHWDTFNLT